MLFERSYPAQVAEQILEEWLAAQGLQIRTEFTSCDHKVSHICLVDAQGNSEAEGSGKGQFHELGAVAEAIEHFFGVKENPEKLIAVSTDTIVEQDLLGSCGIIAGLRNFPRQTVTAVEMETNIESGEAICLVPAILTNPNLPHKYRQNNEAEHFLARYSTNSGTALGIDYFDALVHATNEVIERHCLSHFFLHLVGLRSEVSFKLGTKDFLAELRDQFLNIGLLGRDIKVVLSGSFLGFYFCAVIDDLPWNSGMAVIGSGVSLSRFCAVERGVNEFVQMHCLMTDDLRCEDSTTEKLLSNEGRLSSLVAPDVSNLPRDDQALNDDRFPRSSELMFRDISDRLSRMYPVFFRKRTEMSERFSVVSVFIPGLDRFNLIRTGNIVVPQQWLLENA